MKKLHLFLVAVLALALYVPIGATTTDTEGAVQFTADADTLTLTNATWVNNMYIANPLATKFYQIRAGTTAGSGAVLARTYALTTSSPLSIPLGFWVRAGGVNFDTDDTSTDFKAYLYYNKR